MSIKVSVIIVSYKTPDILAECLKSIFHYTKIEIEVIVIDNKSEDGTVEMIREKYPQVKLIVPDDNLGFSKGNNLGMDIAQGEFFFLLNPDTYFIDETIDQLYQYAINHSSDLIVPKLLNTDQSLQISAWKEPIILDSFLEIFYLHTIAKRNQYDLNAFHFPHKIETASGAAMFFSKSSYERFGGLDENMFWMEDIDLGYRFRKYGANIYYLPNIQLVHIGGESSKKNPRKVISNQLISKIKFYRKHQSIVTASILSAVILIHILTRIILFGLLYFYNKNQKADAYLYTLKKWFNYQFKKDNSI